MGEWLRRTGVMVGPITRPLAGRRLFPLFAVVHQRGRRSGRDYAVPVAIRTSSDGFVIPLPYAGAHWPRNVLAAGECTIRWKGQDHQAVEPRLVAWDEIAHAFNPLPRVIVRLIGIDTFLHLRRCDLSNANRARKSVVNENGALSRGAAAHSPPS